MCDRDKCKFDKDCTCGSCYYIVTTGERLIIFGIHADSFITMIRLYSMNVYWY
jgi:hypothetical protein